MKTMVVIGVTGDVGGGIAAALLKRGHRVIGVARDAGRLAALTAELGDPPALSLVAGNLADDAAGAAMAAAVLAVAPDIHGVVVSINGPRHTPGLFELTSDRLEALISMDMITHFTAARAFVPVMTPGGAYLGIGGGSADFVLEGGVHMSVAQAGLRVLYRGMIDRLRDGPVQMRLLTIASGVLARSTRDLDKPEWVTDAEVGTQAAAMLEDPAAFPNPVWRMTRRDEHGKPGFAADAPTRIQRVGA